MKETPLLFKAEMVRALLVGTKTQTRRIIKSQPPYGKYNVAVSNGRAEFTMKYDILNSSPLMATVKCPYGAISDRIWAKETWQPHPEAGMKDDDIFIPSDAIVYAADLSVEDFELSRPWKSSMFMPRWASRIALEITDIRVQRVQEITRNDAKAEGVSNGWIWDDEKRKNAPHLFQRSVLNPYVANYSELWDQINEKRGFGWDANPWVWVIDFKVIK